MPNITTPACTVSQKCLTNSFIIGSMERKKIGQIQERISSRRLACNPTTQHNVTNLYTKYDYSSFHGLEKSLTKNLRGRTEGRTEGRKDGCTDVNQYTPLFSKRGYNKGKIKSNESNFQSHNLTEFRRYGITNRPNLVKPHFFKTGL